jgi:hypothetical protein
VIPESRDSDTEKKRKPVFGSIIDILAIEMPFKIVYSKNGKKRNLPSAPASHC